MLLKEKAANPRRFPLTTRLTLGAMTSALTLLCLYLAAIMPVGRIPLYFASSIFIYALTCEGAYILALVSYAASTSLALLLLPVKLPAILYVLLLGHYGIFRTILEVRLSSRALKMLIKVLYCDIWLVLGIYLAQFYSGFAIHIPDWLPLWLFVLFAQLAIVFFDLFYGASIALYNARIRRLILPRR